MLAAAAPDASQPEAEERPDACSTIDECIGRLTGEVGGRGSLAPAQIGQRLYELGPPAADAHRVGDPESAPAAGDQRLDMPRIERLELVQRRAAAAGVSSRQRARGLRHERKPGRRDRRQHPLSDEADLWRLAPESLAVLDGPLRLPATPRAYALASDRTLLIRTDRGDLAVGDEGRLLPPRACAS